MAGPDGVPLVMGFDWSEAWEGSEYGVFARALLEAAESFATEAVVAGPPEQLALFG